MVVHPSFRMVTFPKKGPHAGKTAILSFHGKTTHISDENKLMICNMFLLINTKQTFLSRVNMSGV